MLGFLNDLGDIGISKWMLDDLISGSMLGSNLEDELSKVDVLMFWVVLKALKVFVMYFDLKYKDIFRFKWSQMNGLHRLKVFYYHGINVIPHNKI